MGRAKGAISQMIKSRGVDLDVNLDAYSFNYDKIKNLDKTADCAKELFGKNSDIYQLAISIDEYFLNNNVVKVSDDNKQLLALSAAVGSDLKFIADADYNSALAQVVVEILKSSKEEKVLKKTSYEFLDLDVDINQPEHEDFRKFMYATKEDLKETCLLDGKYSDGTFNLIKAKYNIENLARDGQEELLTVIAEIAAYSFINNDLEDLNIIPQAEGMLSELIISSSENLFDTEGLMKYIGITYSDLI